MQTTKKMSKHQKPKKLLIISEWRSGSSMFEYVFTSISGAFHMHEPLMQLSRMRRIVSINDENHKKAIKLIQSLFRCDFSVYKGESIYRVSSNLGHPSKSSPLYLRQQGKLKNKRLKSPSN